MTAPLAATERIEAPNAGISDWQPPALDVLQNLLPQYEILSFIARGGMGAVYKAVQRSLDRTVAIKVLPPEALNDEGGNFVERFKREAQVMAMLEHPGIVAVHQAGETGGLLYIVMEFIEGGDVAQLIASQEKLSPELTLKITTEVCDALAYAHARGVVHRDIKPSNVMIDTEGNIKVADFGLAKITGSDGAGHTRSHLAVGTPDFAAPEAHIPGLEIDQRADLYALGVMLYQMLTGKIPRGLFDMPSAMVAADRRFDSIIDKAMQTDREKRYSTAIELHRDLDQIPRASPAAASRWRPRKRVIAAAAVACFALAATAMSWLRKEPALEMNIPSGPRPAEVMVSKKGFSNSLGMMFVPVPGTGVSFCMHETRHQDFAAYAAATPDTNDGWMRSNKEGVSAGDKPDHPVVSVSWESARRFCIWLSGVEGRTYRLPTDAEWSIAVGLGKLEITLPGITPKMLRGLETTHFPWGTHFPPKTSDRAGNFGDMAWHRTFPRDPWMEGYEDGFATTAPVMSFAPNSFGLYDMAGNVEEMCSDWYDETQQEKVVRGSPYNYKSRERMLSSYRWGMKPLASRYNGTGFRIVSEVAASTPK